MFLTTRLYPQTQYYFKKSRNNRRHSNEAITNRELHVHRFLWLQTHHKFITTLLFAYAHQTENNSFNSQEGNYRIDTKHILKSDMKFLYDSSKMGNLHLKISPGASLNCTRISAFRESKALPAFKMNGTPATIKDNVYQKKG